MSWEVRGNGEKPLRIFGRISLASRAASWRLPIAPSSGWPSPSSASVAPNRLEFIRREFERGARKLSREEFRDRLAHLLAEQFPDETLESLVSSPDLEHSFSGNYARGLLRRGSTHVALLAVPDGESSDAAGNSLSFALLWLRCVRESSCRGALSGVRIILPKNSCGIVAHRLAALDPQPAVELYEHDPALNILAKIDPRRAGNRDAWPVPHRESETLLNQARPVLDAIISLAPRAVSLHWLRVRRQLQSGEIARYGYFQGVALQQVPRLVYLVAPALRFHPAPDDLLKDLSPELEIPRVGLAESWRRGLRVVMRRQLRAVNRLHRRRAAEFSGIHSQRECLKLQSVENGPVKERSG